MIEQSAYAASQPVNPQPRIDDIAAVRAGPMRQVLLG